MQTQTQRESRVVLLSRSAAWQPGLGCLPVFANSLAHERPDPVALATFGWSAIVVRGVTLAERS
jgi:hypothetical protein